MEIKQINENTKEAIRMLACQLIDDEDYYIGWKSNIAMAFVDEYRSFYAELFPKLTEKDNVHILTIANKAAENFLNSVMREQIEKLPKLTFIRLSSGRMKEVINNRIVRCAPSDNNDCDFGNAMRPLEPVFKNPQYETVHREHLNDIVYSQTRCNIDHEPIAKRAGECLCGVSFPNINDSAVMINWNKVICKNVMSQQAGSVYSHPDRCKEGECKQGDCNYGSCKNYTDEKIKQERLNQFGSKQGMGGM